MVIAVRTRIAARLGMGALALAGLGGCRDAPSAQADGTTEGSSGTDDGTPSDGLPTACVAGESRPCYGGPAGSEGLGICRAGVQQCSADGSSWSECSDEVLPEAAERCDTPEDDDCDGANTCEPRLRWWEPLATSILAMAVDSEGHALVAGVTGFALIQGVELEGFYLLELDAEGQLEWVRTLSPGLALSISDLEVTSDDGFVLCGRYEGSPDLGGGPLPEVFFGGFLARFDSDGEHLWSVGEQDQPGSAMTLGSDDTSYVAGLRFDPVVAAHGPDGALRWRQQAEGTFGAFEDGIDIAIASGGDVIVGAVVGGAGEPGPSLGEVPLDLPELGPVLLRLDDSGALIGQRQPPIESGLNVGNLELYPRADGSVLLAANVFGSGVGQTVLLQAYDGTLELLEAPALPTNTWMVGAGPAPDGTTVLGIEFSQQLELGPIGVGLPSFTPGVAIASVDAEGDGRWIELLYGPGGVSFGGLAVGPGGEVLVAGFLDGVAVLGGEAVGGSFLAMIDP